MFIAKGIEYNTVCKHINAPLFKRVFDCETSGKSTIKIAVAGLYRMFLNGTELNRSLFAPYLSNPNEVVFYDEYDVSGKLKARDNVLCVLLGNGFVNNNDFDIWRNETASYRSAPKFFLELKVSGKTIVESDENFLVTDSPITFDDFRCGERYDANLEKENVLTSGSFGGFRKPIAVEPPKGELIKNITQPIKEYTERKAISVVKTEKGYIYDFGLNDTGIPHLKINAKKGLRIDLYFAETIDDNGVNFRSISFDRSNLEYVQHDVYICKDGKQEYKPSFTWHGCRYAEVRGLIDEQATKETLTFISTHSAIEKICGFHCDNEIVNKIADIIIRSDESNFIYYPYDCPHREKNGWTADASLSAEQMLHTFDAYDSLKQWLLCIRKSQRKDGALPGIVPTGGWGFKWGNGPAWDGALIEITYQLYRFGGNIDVLYENSAAIAKYVDYLYTRLNENGLIGFGLGDWLEFGSTYPDSYSTPVEVTDTLTSIELTQKAEQIFCVAGETKNAERAKDLCFLLTENFKKTWIKKYAVTCETQTAQAFAIKLNMFGENSAKAYGELLRIVRRDGRLKTGIIGIKRLLDCLCDYGGEEIAYRLITDEKHSGYAHNLQAGATTLWENFTLYDLSALPNSFVRKDGGGILSLNHHCWGSISAWFFNCIAGLDIVSADSIIISPVYPKRLNSAEAEFCRGERNIRVRWERKADRILLTVENCGFHGYINVGNSRIKLQFGKSEYAF